MIVVAIVVHMLDLVPRGQALAVRELVLELVGVEVRGPGGQVVQAPVRVLRVRVRRSAEGRGRAPFAVFPACREAGPGAQKGGAKRVDWEIFGWTASALCRKRRAGSGRVEAWRVGRPVWGEGCWRVGKRGPRCRWKAVGGDGFAEVGLAMGGERRGAVLPAEKREHHCREDKHGEVAPSVH